MRLLIVDLDGTLCRDNTFSLWVAYSARRLARHGRLASVARMTVWVIARKLRLVSHRRMKHALMQITDTDNPTVIERFAGRVATRFNNNVTDIVNDHLRHADMVVLATAAPSLYAPEVARKAGIRLCVSTPMTRRSADYTECRGEEKLKAVKAITGNWDAYNEVTVVTDHVDDAPLMRANRSGRNILIGTPRKDITS